MWNIVAKYHWVCWHTPIILTLQRLMQEDHKFEASLGYIGRPCLKNKVIATDQFNLSFQNAWVFNIGQTTAKTDSGGQPPPQFLVFSSLNWHCTHSQESRAGIVLGVGHSLTVLLRLALKQAILPQPSVYLGPQVRVVLIWWCGGGTLYEEHFVSYTICASPTKEVLHLFFSWCHRSKLKASCFLGRHSYGLNHFASPFLWWFFSR
jgi:hypothetical protein